MKLLPLLMAFQCCVIITLGQNASIIPQPQQLVENNDQFIISSKTHVVVERGSTEAVDFLNYYLLEHYGFKLKVVRQKEPGSIYIRTLSKVTNGNVEGYQLLTDHTGIYIEGNSAIGSFYGIQSLIQLMPVEKGAALKIPGVKIVDEPRFSYRGAMLDVGRHFFSVSFVKKFLDYMALHKLNYFHWHLTEDQGWRIEIKKYPRLTRIGAVRNGTIKGRYPGNGSDDTEVGGFYTQEQIREIVRYAAKRFITVIPEIEMPGHSGAAIAAYPALSCFPDEQTVIPENMISKKSKSELLNGRIKLVQETWGVHNDVFAPTEYTFNFLQDVLDEVVALFPSKYIHIGGDECPKDAWKKSDFCQQLIKKEGLVDEHGLQSYFIQRIEKYVNKKGKVLIGWDEILEGGLAPNAIVMSWRGEEGGIAAAKEGHQVIMTPGSHVYFDHSQTQQDDSVTIGGFLPLEKVYSYEPIPNELNEKQSELVLGAQGNIWTEYMAFPSKVEYMVFPRLSALSEVLWTKKNKKDWVLFKRKIIIQKQRYKLWNAQFFRNEE